MSEAESKRRRLDRRSFIKGSAGVATGAAVVGAPAAIAISRANASARKVIDKPSSLPSEPITAYVRDAKRGEITVLSGTSETTYQDRALVERLVSAAGPQGELGLGGGR
jgi:TAT (twin-arginine translocation) pathway signal sequence